MVMAPFDKITNTYTGAHAWMYETVVAPAVYESRHAVDEHFLPHLPQNGYVLDVGCGGGMFTKYLADKRPDLRIVAIDLAQPQIDRVRKRMAAYTDRVTFQIGDATNLDFPDETFDGVLSYGSIKHWTDQSRGMGECIRVLKRGGPLLVTEADRSATFEDAERFITFYKAPRFLDRVNLAIFRTWIAGRAIDLDDGRRLADRPDLVDVNVSRIPGSPIMMIAGRRAP